MSDRTQTEDTVYLLRNIHSGYSIHNVFMPIIESERATFHEAPCERADLKSMLVNLKWVRKVACKKGINHMTGGPHYFLLAIPFRRNVLTIHDLVLLKNSKGIKRALFKLIWFYLPVMCAKVVTCITETTRQELLANIRINPKKVVTIHNPVSPLFQFTEHIFNKACPRLLHIGTAWNKNTKRVIAAVQDIPCKLIIIGETDNETTAALKEQGTDYEVLHHLTNEELYKQYQQADIISFPSVFEGFGMPIIEGQATGRAVLTSNRAPMTEVAGDGACFVDPHDIKSIREGLLRIIQDDEYRSEIIKRGTENAKRYQLENIIRQYQSVYQNT